MQFNLIFSNNKKLYTHTLPALSCAIPFSHLFNYMRVRSVPCLVCSRHSCMLPHLRSCTLCLNAHSFRSTNGFNIPFWFACLFPFNLLYLALLKNWQWLSQPSEQRAKSAFVLFLRAAKLWPSLFCFFLRPQMDCNYFRQICIQFKIQVNTLALYYPLIKIFSEVYLCNQLSISSLRVHMLTGEGTPSCLKLISYQWICRQIKMKLFPIKNACKGPWWNTLPRCIFVFCVPFSIRLLKLRSILNPNGVGCFVWIGRCTLATSCRDSIVEKSLDIQTSHPIFAAVVFHAPVLRLTSTGIVKRDFSLATCERARAKK